MNGLKVIGAIAATTLSTIAVLGTTTGVARAFTLGGTLSEQQFQDSGTEISWAAETRIGGVTTTEINIHDSTNSSQNRVEDHYDSFVSGIPVDFSLAFDSLANTLTYTVAGVEVEKTNVLEDSFSDLYIRTSAYVEDTHILVDNLFLQDEFMSGSIANVADSSCLGGVGCGFWSSEYLHIGDIVGDFTLTGRSTMTWGDTKPNNSKLAYQIKLIEKKDVPEPTSLSLLSLSLAGLLVAGKRRKKR
ncbi:MAG: choice-of-anchor W domain-containing protein [Spirulina sp.]